jgi:hypothetical protein
LPFTLREILGMAGSFESKGVYDFFYDKEPQSQYFTSR